LTTEESVAALDEYAVAGGYPEIVVDGFPRERYLATLMDSIVFKDVVRRYRVRYPQAIEDVRRYLSANVATEYSFTRLASMAGMKSKPTIKNYVGYLESAFLFFSLPRATFFVLRKKELS
jgi:predicted AAA+ superfamily ATPase